MLRGLNPTDQRLFDVQSSLYTTSKDYWCTFGKNFFGPLPATTVTTASLTTMSAGLGSNDVCMEVLRYQSLLKASCVDNATTWIVMRATSFRWCEEKC
jgi:hypothetical protein